MAICPTPNCGEKLVVHSRRKYCPKCRGYMGRWWRKGPGEMLIHARRLTRSVFRMDHVQERRIDQQEALSQLRKSKRKKNGGK